MSNKKEHENIEHADWRFQAITTLAKPLQLPNGNVAPAGSPVVQNATVTISEGTFSFGIPNMPALFLNKAHQDSVESNELFSKYLNNHSIKSHNDYSVLFDALEKRMSSVVFSFTAIETFANEKIPDDYVFTKERHDKKCTETYKKEQIERNISIDQKINEILPGIMSAVSPKGTQVWEKFIELKSIRDRIIHMKSKDRVSSNPGDGAIWEELIVEKLPDYSLIAKNIISHFYPVAENMPRWLRKIPF